MVWINNCHYISEQLGRVYVDQRTITIQSSCGKTRAKPCKDLIEGVKRTKNGGTLHIIGNHHIQHTIELSKSISIISENVKQGKITSIVASVDFAFKIRCKEVQK